MDNHYSLFRLTIRLGFCLLTLLFINPSRACVHAHPDNIIVIATGDTLCNLELRFTNLNLAGGAPNEVCACGFAQSIDEHQIEWVVFVDSLTLEPIEGFDLFQFSNEASDSWEDVDPTTMDWSGLIANVNEAGLFEGTAVQMIARFSPVDPPNCQFSEELLFEILGTFALGTDAFDPVAGELADHHQDITYFSDGDVIIETNTASPQYFIDLDSWYAGLVTGIQETEFAFEVFPNPANSTLNLSANAPGKAELFNIQGRSVIFTRFRSGANAIDLCDLRAGVYVLLVSTNNSIKSTKILIQ